MPVGPEVGGEVADRRLERRLGDAHHVVVRRDALRAEVGQREDRAAAMEEGTGGAGHRDERVGRDLDGEQVAVARRVEERALEVLALRVGDGVDEDVDLAVRLLPAVHHALDVGVGLGVGGLDEGAADRLGEGPDAALDEALDGREPDDRALLVEGLRDAPGDRVVVRDPEDQRLAALQQSHLVLASLVRLRYPPTIMPEMPRTRRRPACSVARGPGPAARPRRRPRAGRQGDPRAPRRRWTSSTGGRCRTCS